MMKEKMIHWAIDMVLAKMTEEDIKKWVDIGLDIIEDKVQESPNKFDDAFVLPMTKLIRTALNVPDNDE